MVIDDLDVMAPLVDQGLAVGVEVTDFDAVGACNGRCPAAVRRRAHHREGVADHVRVVDVVTSPDGEFIGAFAVRDLRELRAAEIADPYLVLHAADIVEPGVGRAVEAGEGVPVAARREAYVDAPL